MRALFGFPFPTSARAKSPLVAVALPGLTTLRHLNPPATPPLDVWAAALAAACVASGAKTAIVATLEREDTEDWKAAFRQNVAKEGAGKVELVFWAVPMAEMWRVDTFRHRSLSSFTRVLQMAQADVFLGDPRQASNRLIHYLQTAHAARNGLGAPISLRFSCPKESHNSKPNLLPFAARGGSEAKGATSMGVELEGTAAAEFCRQI
jgi:hypothetical protein